MIEIDYLVTASGVIERANFYNYVHELGYKDDTRVNRDYMVHSDYPFGVCMKEKILLVVESATNAFLMQKNNKVITAEKFMELMGDNYE